MESKKVRSSNIELLRIVAMVFILFHHYSLYNSLYTLDLGNINKYIGILFFSLGKIGVNIFILITGYFLIQKKFSIKKLIKLWLEVLFYSIGIFLIFCICGKVQLNIKELIKFIFPISYNKYWFITIYLILYILMPIINRYVSKISKEQYKKMIIILFILSVGLYSIMYGTTTYMINETFPFSNMIFYVLIYLVGGYIRLYGIKNLENVSNKKMSSFIFALFLIFMLFLIISQVIDYKWNKLGNVVYWYTRSNSIFIFVLSILIFYIFKNINLKEIKIINLLASTCFGVYLIQSHSFIAGKRLYKEWLHTELFINSPLLIIQAIISIVIIFLGGSCIDLVRQKLLEEKFMRFSKLDNLFKKIDNAFND